MLGGDAESIGLGFSNWQVEAKRARRGCLTAPSLPWNDGHVLVALDRSLWLTSAAVKEVAVRAYFGRAAIAAGW